MRRKDREIPKSQLNEIIARQKVCRLGLCKDDMPYVVPLSFGYDMNDEKLTLYFHCATEGLKLDIIAHNNNAFFEMDSHINFLPGDTPCQSTAKYESVMGRGIIEIVEDYGEKVHALTCICNQYAEYGSIEFLENHVSAVKVLKLIVSEYKGKRN